MIDMKETEDEVLAFWEKKKIYSKSVNKNSKGKKFYFMDGPPYATGKIHMGTALNKTLKDIAMRSRRLQGFDVFDRPGYDTHGVPIEFQVEKEIGSTCKQDIEKYGITKFVAKCREFATKHIGVMNKEFQNLGVWLDWDNPYLTLEDEYMEAIWDTFKEADKKGLLYLGKYPVHVCPRCETAVAFNEIEYTKIKDNSIYVKFPLNDKKKTFLIIWTTTPWTLPGNTGVMVNPEVDYQEVKVGEEKWIIAKDLVSKVMGKAGEKPNVTDEFKGKKMEGWSYTNPIAKNLKLNIKNGYKVILSSRYVTTEEGTGLVHSAPGHGKEDYEVGKKYKLDMPSPVGADGILTEEAGKYVGKKAREVDSEIIADLEKDGFIVAKEIYQHDYPLCWRDKSPLLMISQPQWFLKISKIQKKLLKENEKTIWTPKWMQLRMKAWLEGISDWPISRQRYWGTPLPIWYDPESGEKIVVGSLKELEKLSGVKKIDMHKPGIDKIEIKYKGKTLKRVPEVLDVWFDSGVSSWAALGYPSKKDKFKKFWPADLNIEGKDMVRGWWNSQIILSEITFDKKPFDNVMVHGMVLDLGKKKMSKSVGNVVSPEEIIKENGRDYLRYYFAKHSKGEDFSFGGKGFADIGKIFMTLHNINRFVDQLNKKKGKISVEDKWILSRFNSLVKEVTENYNTYKFPEVVNKLEEFLIFDLSRRYIQIIRERADETKDVLNEIRLGLLKLLAPIIPFTTETIWQKLKQKEESIHLSDWPKVKAREINTKLEKEFDLVFQLVEKGLAERSREKVGLRWPLGKATLSAKESISKPVQEIIARQLNVKKVDFKVSKEISVSLDTRMTPVLEAEGFAREIARAVQAERKKRGLAKGDLITLELYVSGNLKDMLQNHLSFLKERTNSKEIKIADDKKAKNANVFTIKERTISFNFS